MRLFVPGRICLFGEHSDWAGGHRRTNAAIEKGYCLITGTNQGIYAEVAPHPSHLVVTADLGGPERVGPRQIPMDPDSLLAEAQAGGPFAYIAGVAYQVLMHHHVQGLVIDNDRTDLPVKKGLSSSAAACVLTARAFNRLYDLKLTVRGEMELAYRGELTTPSRCGRMDQGCAFGRRPVLMTFDADLVDVRPLRVGGEFHLLVVDLKKGKDTRKILADLNQCYPFPRSDRDRAVHDYLGPTNKRIVHEAVRAIEAGDARRLGALMTEAQALFDRFLAPVCPEELTAPKLHEVLAYGPIRDLVWGGKGVGSQGDGAAQLVARSAEARDRAAEILERDLGVACLPLDITPPRRIRKAVIPAAGFGTRMFPASKAVKKELAPVVDRDGLAKPIIQVIVEEAVRAGIDEVALVVQPSDRPIFEAFFKAPLPPAHLHRLPARAREHAEYLQALGRRVTFIEQPRQEGFGHAVLCAREWVAGEPFLLMLGDHLYRSETDTSCAEQVIAAYERAGGHVIGLTWTPAEEVSNFGTVAGTWTDGGLLTITEFAEKPSRDYAEAHLVVPPPDGPPEEPPRAFLTVFGLYALGPGVFEHLQDLCDHNMRRGGEFQLTDALERLRRAEPCFGCVVRGRRFDTGRPEAYLETLLALAPERRTSAGDGPGAGAASQPGQVAPASPAEGAEGADRRPPSR